jgi:hypothetical protein
MVDGAEGAPSVNGSRRRARELAEGVFWLALGGRTQTNVYLVLGDRFATVVDAGWAADGPVIRAAVRHVLGAHRRPASILLTHAHTPTTAVRHASSRRPGNAQSTCTRTTCRLPAATSWR